jgi:hypothetical protein
MEANAICLSACLRLRGRGVEAARVASERCSLEDRMNLAWLASGALVGLLCIAPAPPPIDVEALKAELLALHQADRRAHF